MNRWSGAVLAAVMATITGVAHAAPETDYIPPTSQADVLSLPGTGISGQARKSTRYALSYVVIPVKGRPQGFARSGVKKMTRRIADRMESQTDERYGYGFAGWSKAPKAKDSDLSCDLEVIHRKYQKYVKNWSDPPDGYRDTVAVYLTPLRRVCSYAGVAMLRGRAVYLNGVDLSDPTRLQDWITAHELGHTLGLEHAASFWPRDAGWTYADPVPRVPRLQDWADYGDYLDLMGQPAQQGDLDGLELSRWSFSALNLEQLRVIGRRNLTVVRNSGRYTIDRVSADPAGGRMMLAVPVLADGEETAWTLEYRPSWQNQKGLRYPEPYVTRGYGVRLTLAGAGMQYPNYMNRTFHVDGRQTAQASLPVGQVVRLGGGGTVTVVELSRETAIIDVMVP